MAMILDFLISRTLTVVTNKVEVEIFKVLGVDKEIKVFQGRLETIQGYLQQTEQTRHINDKIDIWMRKLKDIMYDADDVIDRMSTERELLKAQALSDTSTVSNPCNYFSSCFQSLRYRHHIANRIRELNDELEELKKDMSIKQYLDQTTKEPIEYVNRVITRETPRLLVEGKVIGTQIEIAADKLIDLILENNPKKCRVFGVVGTGGIGKSTLARKIFRDKRIKDNFPIRIWLDISKNSTEFDLLQKLINYEEGIEVKGENLEWKLELEDKLVSVLTRNTFIVLDNVWNSFVWAEFLRKPIIENAANCTVLVTSRKEKVLAQMKHTYIHQVEKMNEESGWTFLKHLVFEGGDDDEISNFKDIGIKLVNKCNGLPLAIKAIAVVLCQPNIEKWKEVLQSDAWNKVDIEEVLRPLYLSYEDLPSRFKPCFLYCSLYPQKDMYYKEIVQFWAAEGLIMCEDECRNDHPIEYLKTMEDSGEEIYRELIGRNLLEANANLDGSKNYFSMHDHFRSLCANLMREEGMLFRHGREFKVNDNVKIRRLSISYMEPKLVLPDQIAKQACLRTLILTDSPTTKMIQDSVLKALPCLRVLDLSDTSIESIPDCIRGLLHLRYLDLAGTKIYEIPMTIGDLVNLQSLNISRCDFLERLPVSITKLHNLRWLDMRHSPLLTYVPKGIEKLENLYSLQGFMVRKNDSEEGCDLEELKNLSKLRGISIFRLERAKGGANALANKLLLRELELGWEGDDNGGSDKAKSGEEADGDGKDDEDAKNDLGDGNDDGSGQQNQSEEAEEDENESEKEKKRWSEQQISKAETICNEMDKPPRTIFDILFHQYPGRQLPSWMISSSLAESFPNLTYLSLLGLPCCTVLPPLGTLPQLKHLRIQSASTITAIGSQFLGSSGTAFPKLEVLRFANMPAWEEWTFNGTLKLFPKLRDCIIIKCPKLRVLPDGLQQLCLRQTYGLREIDKLTLAYKLEVTNGRGLKKISNIPNLRYLEVHNCPNLECVENLGQLQHLVLTCSRKTKQFPQWLLGLIEQHNNAASAHRSLRQLEMQCNLQLLKSCLSRGNWDVIQQIPNVKIQTYSGKDYIRYTKDPYLYDKHVAFDRDDVNESTDHFVFCSSVSVKV